MNAKDLFEAHFAEVHLQEIDKIKAQRMGTDSYRLPAIASSWRMFRAGYEAKEGELLRMYNEVSIENAQNAKLLDKWEMPSEAGTAKGGVDFEGESGGGVVKMTTSGANSEAKPVVIVLSNTRDGVMCEGCVNGHFLSITGQSDSHAIDTWRRALGYWGPIKR